MSAPQFVQEVIHIIRLANNGQEFNLTLPSGKGVFIGSAANCALQLQGGDVSPIHCRIAYDGQSIHIHDWMSSTGTFVDGKRIDGVAEVSTDCVIQIGSHRLKISESLQAEEGDSTFDSQIWSDPALSETPSKNSTYSPASSARNSPLVPPSELDDRNPFGQDLSIGQLDDCFNTSEPTHAAALLEEVLPKDLEDTAVHKRIDRESLDEEPIRSEENLPFDEPQAWSEDDWAEKASLTAWEDHSAEDCTELALNDGLSSSLSNLDKPLSDASLLEARVRDLIFEAELSDQRIRLLEDQLLAAESAQAAQAEERQCLEAWLQDIELKFSSREEEHAAELEQLQQTIAEKNAQLRLHRERLTATDTPSGSNTELLAMLEHLRSVNSQLEQQLQESRQHCRQLEQQAANIVEQQTEALRAELTELAIERAELARQRHDLMTQLSQVTQIQREPIAQDGEMDYRLRVLREHLREIHRQEQQDRSELSLTARLSKLWHRVTQ